MVASLFYLGHSPLMPGTVGSLAGLVVYFLVNDSAVLYGFSILFIFVLGIIFSGEAEHIYKHKDARVIVIDEACGMLIALVFLPYNIIIVALGFVLFRLFDIIKPPPARKAEKLAGAWGIMIDDILAAFYTNIVLQVVVRIFKFPQ